MHDTILHRDKMAVVRVHILLHGPSEITMVKDITLAILCSNSVCVQQLSIHIILPQTEANITDNKILGATKVHLIVSNDDSHTRSCLSGDRVVLTIDTQVFDKPNLSGYGKTNRQRLVGELFDCPTKRTFCGSFGIVCQRRHVHYSTSSSAGSVFTKTLCSWECHNGIRQKACRGY